MMRGARTTLRGVRAMMASALAKCSAASAATLAQAWPSAGLRRHCLRIVARDAGLFEILARHIEAADAGVLVDVAQRIGELQRAAEMMGERDAVRLAHAEHAHATAARRR